MHRACRLLLGLLITSTAPFCIAEEITFFSDDDSEIIVERHAADGDFLLLWLAPEYGFRQAHQRLAAGLQAEGIEVWQSDIAESLFLPRGASTLKQLDGRHVAALVERAHATSGKKIALAGDAYGAVGALRGARRWQARNPGAEYLVGAVLFTPYSYAYLPPLGIEPEYLPIVGATNIPLMIYQAKQSATTIQFDTLLKNLRRHQSPVYTRLVPDVMSLFYEEQPTPAMIEQAALIPANLKKMLPLLSRHGLPKNPIAIAENTDGNSGIDVYLKEFRGQTRPDALRLDDIDGNPVVREDFRGRVTLVNFWASWCPPCVEEIPSLNRLQQKMAGRPFELISINYAQEAETVAEFMRRVRVDFPVLLDRDGAYARRWNVISYPSTFVIDRDGNIRYGVNAAIEWDAPELIGKLEALMQ